MRQLGHTLWFRANQFKPLASALACRPPPPEMHPRSSSATQDRLDPLPRSACSVNKPLQRSGTGQDIGIAGAEAPRDAGWVASKLLGDRGRGRQPTPQPASPDRFSSLFTQNSYARYRVRVSLEPGTKMQRQTSAGAKAEALKRRACLASVCEGGSKKQPMGGRESALGVSALCL